MAGVSEIQAHMPVVDANNQQIATVDHVDKSATLKLTKDAQGQHHWVPLSWITAVDSAVHLDRPEQVVTQEWSTTAPTLAP